MHRPSSDHAAAPDGGAAPPSVEAAGQASHTLTFPQLGRSITTVPGESIYQAARRHGVRIVGACGGRGKCGTCMVMVHAGEVQHVSGRPLARREGRARWVPACQVRALTDCTLDVDERSLAPVVRAETGTGDNEHLPFDPEVAGVDVSAPRPSLSDPRSDSERIAHALASFDTVDLAAARQLPAVARANDWSVRVLLRGSEAIGFAPPRTPILGLAIDLGTTNVGGFLIDLDSGRRLATLGIENPQVAWGADVISRINHALRDAQAAEQLRTGAVAAIDAIARDLCAAIGAVPAQIADVTVCGNTAMHHLLLGLPVRHLGQSPFVAAVCNAVDVKARDLGLGVAPGAYVHLPANIGGFVGGDHVAALLATEARWRPAGTTVVMDIGTNTELSLIHRGEIRTTSCPSGPALEGGHISCGMRAADGAIEHVGAADGQITLDVIGGKTAIGLCGSGVLDAVATLYRIGLLRGSGRLGGSHPGVVDRDGERLFMLTPTLGLSQHDVRAVQLAKAAIQTGLELLLGEAGIAEQEIECFIIAGAFGAYINVASGIEIGMFPALPLDRFQQIGNAAGLGARQMLTSRRARARAAELAAACRYLELNTRADFQKVFLRNIAFPAASHGEQRDRLQQV